jgi:hypothetical protein
MYRAFLILCVFLAVAISLPSDSNATQIIHRTPQQLGSESSLVVRGTVASVRSYWNDSRTKIFTETLVDIAEAYKGGSQASVRIVQLGGIVGNIKVSVAGALQWRVGEEVLLFAEQAGADSYRVSGFSQGKFHIERDVKTGKPYVTRPALKGVEVLKAPGLDEPVRVSPLERVPLEQFVQEALPQR